MGEYRDARGAHPQARGKVCLCWRRGGERVETDGLRADAGGEKVCAMEAMTRSMERRMGERGIHGRFDSCDPPSAVPVSPTCPARETPTGPVSRRKHPHSRSEASVSDEHPPSFSCSPSPAGGSAVENATRSASRERTACSSRTQNGSRHGRVDAKHAARGQIAGNSPAGDAMARAARAGQGMCRL